MSETDTKPATTKPESQPEELLTVEHLRVTLGGPSNPQTVVQDNSFDVRRGCTTALVGESGSGKSVTSLAIMGLLPKTAVVSGSVRLKGKELLGLGDRVMRTIRGDQLAMIFQDPLSSLNPYYTVGLQIAEAYVAHRGGSIRKVWPRVIESLERVHIPDPPNRAKQYPHQFSGGMRQRIMIAMALCCEPDLIIADEPTTALDVSVQQQILQLLAEIQADAGTGILFITHDLAVVSEIADQVLVMQRGVQVESGPARQVFDNPQHSYTKMLLAATPSVDDEVPDLLTPQQIREHAARIGG